MANLTRVSLNGNASDVPDAYSKTETNSLLNAKQNRLTAGTGITISGDTISSDAYSKSETDTLLAGKQDELTAGTGINISSNNVISATGGSATTLYDAPLDSNGNIHTGGAITPTGLVNALYSYDYENKELLGIKITGPARTGGWRNMDAAIAIGVGASAGGDGSVAVGNNASVSEYDGVAIGNSAKSIDVDGECDGVAIGPGARTDYGGVAIGSGAEFYGDYNNRAGVAIGRNSVSLGNEVSFGNASVGFTRRVTSISDGIAATDAATKGQLDAAIATLQAQIDALRNS